MENLKKTDVVKQYDEPVLVIKGGNPLSGSVEIEGAKNAALPALAAACLGNQEVLLLNVPTELNDIKQILILMSSMGVDVDVNQKEKTVRINGSQWSGGALDGDIAGSIRHSLLLLGVSVAWKKPLELPIPGGCNLGSRKHDMHIDALQKLGNNVNENGGIEVYYQPGELETTIDFYYPTFGGTFNALFASVKRAGKKTIIKNAAKNPEVLDVIAMLRAMGSVIEWKDNRTLVVEGVETLNGVSHSIMPDRIVGATIIASAGITKGNVTIKNFKEDLLTAEISVWREAGLTIQQKGHHLVIKGSESVIKSVDIETRAYPGFHTDIQPLHVLLMTTAEGTATVKETILDGRFRYCAELEKLGANINVRNGHFKCVNGAQGQIATVNGVKTLKGNEVQATDIRGGAAVAVAGIAAAGTTVVKNLYQLERGYGNFVELFETLGADITRIGM